MSTAVLRSLLITDIWLNDHYQPINPTGLGQAYQWRHHWRVWAVMNGDDVWLIIRHTQSTYLKDDPFYFLEISHRQPNMQARQKEYEIGLGGDLPRGHSLQDTTFILAEHSRSSFWANLMQEPLAEVWPNPECAKQHHDLSQAKNVSHWFLSRMYVYSYNDKTC
jgi:hypothetical protein